MVGDLISAAQRSLAFTKPGNLPGKAHGGTHIAPVLGKERLRRVGRIRPDVLDLRRAPFLRVREPVTKARARQAEQRAAAAGQTWRQSAGFPRHAVVLPANAKVERKISPDFPVVLG